MKTAIYLCVQGPYREPRTIELQYMRILRYLDLVNLKLDKSYDIDLVFIDINYPRVDRINDLPEFTRLNNEVISSKVSTIFVDIDYMDSLYPEKYLRIVDVFKASGAHVYNSCFDYEQIQKDYFIERFCCAPNEMIPNDIEEFVALFPSLSAKITEDVLGGLVNKKNRMINKDQMDSIIDSLRFLKRENPYSSGRELPWISDKKSSDIDMNRNEWFDERRETEDIYILSPENNGLLWDEMNYHPRKIEELDWVDLRLKLLNFEHKIDQKEHTYTRSLNGYLLYADPRISSSIIVDVYLCDSENVDLVRKKKKKCKHIGQIKIQDYLKNNLETRLINQLGLLIGN